MRAGQYPEYPESSVCANKRCRPTSASLMQETLSILLFKDAYIILVHHYTITTLSFFPNRGLFAALHIGDHETKGLLTVLRALRALAQGTQGTDGGVQHFRLFVPPTELRRLIELDRKEEAFFLHSTAPACQWPPPTRTPPRSGPPTQSTGGRKRSIFADLVGLIAPTPRPIAAPTPRDEQRRSAMAPTPRAAIVRVAKREG